MTASLPAHAKNHFSFLFGILTSLTCFVAIKGIWPTDICYENSFLSISPFGLWFCCLHKLKEIDATGGMDLLQRYTKRQKAERCAFLSRRW